MPDLSEIPAGSAPKVGIFDLIRAFQRVLKRFEGANELREIVADKWSVSDKIEYLLDIVPVGGRVVFESLFSSAASRSEVIVTFLAVLELIKLNHLEIEQEGMLGAILVIRPSV
jgi:segregation and condensation protein A